MRNRPSTLASVLASLMFGIPAAGDAFAVADPLTALDDEFGSAQSAASWSRVHATEGWNADQLQIWDINGVAPGRLTMVPHTSVWYQDWRAELTYKEVTGNFIVRTRVAVSDLDPDAGTVPGRQFDLAGLMARAPRNITPATWAPGGEDYVFIALGNGTNANTSFQIEEKTTNDSVSDLVLRDVGAGVATLQIARVGDTFITLYQIEDGPWNVFRRHERPDLPQTLQLGMHAYTDWPQASQLDPLAHNGTVIPTFPATVPGTTVSGFPDLRAEFDWIRFSRPVVPAALAGLDLADASAVSDQDLIAFLTPVPEPGMWLQLLAGGAALIVCCRRWRTAAVPTPMTGV